MKGARLGWLLLAPAVVPLPAAREDTSSLRIVQTVEARFPAALALSPISSGEVRVVISVDPEGRLEDVLIAGYTEKAFADEVTHLLRLWSYEPARRDGRRIGVRAELKVNFEATGRVISLMTSDVLEVLASRVLQRTYIAEVVRPPDLDRPPEAVQRVAPPKPAELVGGTGGSVVLDFYIDAKGLPRMPVVIATSHPELADLAAGALLQWRFAPPTSDGRPVGVRVRQEFVFRPGA